MNKQQKLGQLRAALTAAGTALATWGVNDGNAWAPVVGLVIALVSATWGILHHKDPAKPGSLRWSLVRKAFNAAGAAAITYGWLNPEKVQGMEMLIAALGPLVASWFSWIDNSDKNDGDGYDEPDPPRRGDVGLWLMFIAVTSFLLMPGCTVTVTPDGSVSATIDDAPAAVRVIEVLSQK